MSAERVGVGEMTELRFHFGERDRDGDGPLEAAVIDACAHHGVAAAVTLRGVEGFGAKQRLRTDRLLSLSEDAPLVVVAVGDTAVVQALAEEVEEMAGDGLMTLTPIVTSAATGSGPTVGAERDSRSADLVRATVWGPRGGAGSPHLATVAALHAHGAEAATVLLGVDGVLGGERRRARFVGGNRGVPAITVAVGERATVEAALADLDPAPSLVTFEPVESSSRIARATLHSTTRADGEEGASAMDRPGRHARVTLVTSEIAAHQGHPRYLALIHALREGGAAGATALRGVWGFRGDLAPHGDRVLALRRDVPILVETVDAPDQAERWAGLARSLAGAEDVVYSQAIPSVTTLG